jgi:uncharacterized protein (TIGR00156 family)
MFLVMALAAPAHAAFEGPGAPLTVKDSSAVKTAPKDTPVVLEGMIVSKAGDDMYIFQDAAGDVLVEIDDDVMKGRKVTPQSKVRLNGHVDSEDGKPTVEVDMLEVLD